MKIERDIQGTGQTAEPVVSLMARLAALAAEMEAAAEARFARWEKAISREEFLPTARNLSDYLALRHADLRPFQPRLAALGLSSLGRAEAHVRPTIEAVLAALSAIAGGERLEAPAADSFTVGAATLARRRDALFGPGMAPGQLATRIMATLPSEAANNPALVARLVAEGIDCVRINTAHDGPEAWAAMIGHVRKAGVAAGRPIAIAMDLAGPKIRTVAVSEKARLKTGDRFALSADGQPVRGLPVATLSHPDLIAQMTAGTPVWIDDGKIRARVTERVGDAAVLEVVNTREKGTKLKPEKGVNLPGTDLAIPALTAADREILGFVARHADIIGYSFVQTREDVGALLAALGAICGEGPKPAVMLKIETPQAVRNLPELIVRAGGSVPVAVMIARGDLAVEIGFERLAEMQEEILWLCEAASVPVVWATQVLDGLLHEGQASRAETTDAAMGQRAECVMLNKGPFLPEAVSFLREILIRMERHQHKKFAWLGPLSAWRD